MKQLDRAAAEVARQNYAIEVEVTSEDEMGRLARTFNTMCASIRQAREDLIRQERISTIGRLSGSIVHDLRNPLAAIYGGAKSPRSIRHTAKPERRNVAPTRVDIKDLHSAYRSNAVAALNKYGSGPFLVTGQVKGVGEELGKMMVHFHTNDDAVLSDVSGAEKIQPYQTVTVLCSGVKSFGPSSNLKTAPFRAINLTARSLFDVGKLVEMTRSISWCSGALD